MVKKGTLLFDKDLTIPIRKTEDYKVFENNLYAWNKKQFGKLLCLVKCQYVIYDF